MTINPDPSTPSTECLVGWRGWRLCHPHYLVGGNLVYEPRKRHEAHCGYDHMAPALDCTCGIYSFTSLDELCRQGYQGQEILGEVYLWGRIIEHERGYRSQYAYPKKLYLGSTVHHSGGARSIEAAALASYLGFLYGVPMEECPIDSSPKSRARTSSTTYEVTDFGRLPANLYQLAPRVKTVVEVLDALSQSQTGPVSREQLSQALQRWSQDESPVIGHGVRDVIPDLNYWKVFTKFERFLLSKGYIRKQGR